VCIHCSSGFHHGISHMSILCFNHTNLLYYSLFPYLPSPLLFNSFQWFSYAIFTLECSVFPYYSLSILLFHLLLVPSNSPRITDMFYIHVCIWSCMYLCIFHSLPIMNSVIINMGVVLSFESYLCILDINPLLNIWFITFLFPSVAFLFIPLTIFLTE
jgi:hypothetical protein